MFTGIIEDVAEVIDVEKVENNLNIKLKTRITNELKIDQSISHNGVCLTVVDIKNNSYTVTAIKETLEKSNLKTLAVGSKVNIERAMKLGERLDGHIVQGHIDQTAICTTIKNEAGSWKFTFEYDKNLNNITIEKGSVTVNGVSLTVVDSTVNSFSVAIIPYTFEHTTFKNLKIQDEVNLEFDVIGKYVKKLLSLSN
jgi:riboflavin synthase